MTLFAYDPLAVDSLRRRMRAAADELTGIHSADPAAAAAVAAATAVRRLLEWTWMPAIGDLLATDPLGRDGPRWVGASPANVPAGDAVITPGATCALPDDMVVRRLDDLAAARAALVASHGPDPDDADAAAELAALDARIEAVARAYVAGLERAGGTLRFPAVLLVASPYAAALALRSVHRSFDPTTLAAIGLSIVRRWHGDADHRTGWLDAQWYGPNAADVLFEVLAQHPHAATAFLLQAEPHEVLDGTASIAPVTALLAAGTAPTQMDEATAGRVLVPLVRWARDHDPVWPADHPLQDTPVAFATALTPWLSALHPRAAAWGWKDDEGGDTLHWMLDHPDAAAAVRDAAVVWQGRLADTPFLGDDGRIHGSALHDLAWTIDMIDQALYDRTIDDVERQEFVIGLAFTAAQAIAGAVAPGGPVTNAAVDVGMSVVTPLARSTLERIGVLPSTDHRRDAAHQQLMQASTQTLVIAVTTTVATMIERGDLPADTLDGLDLDGIDTDDVEAVIVHLTAFVDELPAGVDAATVNALHTVINAFADRRVQV